MNKIIKVVFLLLIIGAVGWFFLLRPEQITQENLTQEFTNHEQSYKDIAYYLTKNNITTRIDNIPIAGTNYPGVKNDETPEYGSFIDAIYVVMEEDRDLIQSDGNTVEFIFHSTGGLLNRRKGSVIFCIEDTPPTKEAVPLSQNGWYIRISE